MRTWKPIPKRVSRPLSGPSVRLCDHLLRVLAREAAWSGLQLRPPARRQGVP